MESNGFHCFLKNPSMIFFFFLVIFRNLLNLLVLDLQVDNLAAFIPFPWLEK